MIRLIYYVRAFFISVEFLAVLLGLAIYLYCGDELTTAFEGKELNEDALRWFAVFPVGVTYWTLNEARSVVFPDKEAIKILKEWPDYWKLKAHFHSGITFCVLFVIPCLFLWSFDELRHFEGAWAFFTFTVALVLNAGSFYLAKIELKNILAHT